MAVQFIKIGHLRVNTTEIKGVRFDPAGTGVWVQIGGITEQVTGDDAQIIRAWVDGQTIKAVRQGVEAPPVQPQASQKDGSPVKTEPKKGTTK